MWVFALLSLTLAADESELPPLVPPASAAAAPARHLRAVPERPIRLPLASLAQSPTVAVDGPALVLYDARRIDTRPLMIMVSDSAGSSSMIGLGTLTHKAGRIDLGAGAHTLTFSAQGTDNLEGQLVLLVQNVLSAPPTRVVASAPPATTVEIGPRMLTQHKAWLQQTPYTFTMSGPAQVTIHAFRHLAITSHLKRPTILTVRRERDVVLGMQLSQTAEYDRYDGRALAVAPPETFMLAVPEGVHTYSISVKDKLGCGLQIDTGAQTATTIVTAVAPAASAVAVQSVITQPVTAQAVSEQLAKLQVEQLRLQEEILRAKMREYLEGLVKAGTIPGARYVIEMQNPLLFELVSMRVEADNHAVVERAAPVDLSNSDQQVAMPGPLPMHVLVKIRYNGAEHTLSGDKTFAVDSGHFYVLRVITAQDEGGPRLRLEVVERQPPAEASRAH